MLHKISRYPLTKRFNRAFSQPSYQPPKTSLNPLKQIIMNEIKTGQQPMNMARFMELGLMHPQYGYYSTKEHIFNKGGDFTTSPEISQMFGEMIGLWFLTALRNYATPEQLEQDQMPQFNTLNIVEIGPGSGIMMSDILRTVSQFTNSLRNIQVTLVEASSNLIQKQQDRLMKDLQDRMNMFLTYDIEASKKNEKRGSIDRFYNKDQNFSIQWVPSIKEYYNSYLMNQYQNLKPIADQNQEHQQLEDEKIKQLMLNPCFILAHELYDALPINQFEFGNDYLWHERVIKLAEDQQDLELTLSEGNSENVKKVLKPEKLFKDRFNEVKPGDQIEICQEAVNLTKDINSLVEVSRGISLVIDYGEDHAFSNSFRGFKEHKLIKDFKEIVDNIGNVDLTSYVNFEQIKAVAQSNSKSKVCEVKLGISSCQRVNASRIVPGKYGNQNEIRSKKLKKCLNILQILQKNAKTAAQKQLLEDSYVRLCHPDQMGKTYKMLYMGHKDLGEVYPFISEESEDKPVYYG